MDSLLRAQDVAEILNVRTSTIYALANRGVLPCVRIHRAKRPLIRFRSEDIERLIRERTVPAKESRKPS